MILAAGFGVLSAVLETVNEQLSILFNAVLVHLFAFEALGLELTAILYWHVARKLPCHTHTMGDTVQTQQEQRDTPVVDNSIIYCCNNTQKMCPWFHWSTLVWICLGNVFFVVGSWLDVVLAWLYLYFDKYNAVDVAYAAVAAAVCWNVASIALLVVSVIEYRYYQRQWQQRQATSGG